LRTDAEVELALEVRGHRLEAGEADLHPHLAQFVDQHQPGDARRQAVRGHEAPGEEFVVDVGQLARALFGLRPELLDLGGPQRRTRWRLAAGDRRHRREHRAVARAAQGRRHFGDSAERGQGGGRGARQHVPDAAHPVLELARRIGDRNRAHHLREVGVRGGPHQQS